LLKTPDVRVVTFTARAESSAAPGSSEPGAVVIGRATEEEIVRSTIARKTLATVVGAATVVALVAAAARGGSGSTTITTIAGSVTATSLGDGGPATRARLSHPEQLAVDKNGNVYVADTRHARVRKITPEGTITTIAGSGKLGPLGDGGPARAAGLYPSGVAVDGKGNVYVTDNAHERVRRITPDGTITTVAGTGRVGADKGDGGPATSATLWNPHAVAIDGQGNLFIAGTSNQRVRKVSPDGTITTIAGTGRQGFSGDGGPARSARLHDPYGVAVDRHGSVYIADSGNHRVRKVSPGGRITTIAGTGSPGYSGDGGPATAARLHHPRGVAVDARGNLYIADSENFRIRMVSDGTITTIAGTGRSASSGDGGPPRSAQLEHPTGVAVDGKGFLYIADARCLRMVSPGRQQR